MEHKRNTSASVGSTLLHKKIAVTFLSLQKMEIIRERLPSLRASEFLREIIGWPDGWRAYWSFRQLGHRPWFFIKWGRLKWKKTKMTQATLSNKDNSEVRLESISKSQIQEQPEASCQEVRSPLEKEVPSRHARWKNTRNNQNFSKVMESPS